MVNGHGDWHLLILILEFSPIFFSLEVDATKRKLKAKESHNERKGKMQKMARTKISTWAMLPHKLAGDLKGIPKGQMLDQEQQMET